MVIVDTCIWSYVFRKNKITSDIVKIQKRLLDLIELEKVVLLGPIRQEILSGIKYEQQFIRLRDYFRNFPDFQISSDEHELAASYFNLLRSKGIQGSNVDFLICAIAAKHNFYVFTEDKNFQHYQKFLNVKIMKI